MTPHLLLARQLPHDIGKPILCMMEQRFQVFLPVHGRVLRGLLEARRGRVWLRHRCSTNDANPRNHPPDFLADKYFSRSTITSSADFSVHLSCSYLPWRSLSFWRFRHLPASCSGRDVPILTGAHRGQLDRLTCLRKRICPKTLALVPL